MIVIRSEQVDALKEAALSSFKDEMLAHLREFSPPLFEILGEEQMRAFVEFGMAQAKNYDFTFRGPVQFYLEMMMLFGSYFDTDPQYAWANQILKDDSVAQMQRAEELYAKTMDYQEKVVGPEDKYTQTALQNISTRARQAPPVPSNDFVQDAMQVVYSLYPQKAEYVGKQGLETLIRSAMAEAENQQFKERRELYLLVMLMFYFGHGCGRDLLYPWIGKNLNEDAEIAPADRARRLEKNALTFVDHVLANF